MKRFLRIINHYLAFFLLAAFLVTCCIMLFTSTLMNSLGITLTGENLETAAKLTFGNVLLLSLLFTVVDIIRRKMTVDRTARRIAEAARKIVAGDFSVRVPLPSRMGSSEGFREIVDCFNEMAQELSGVETLRTDFISNVSHEMKTPLAAMNNYGRLLQAPGLPEEKRMEYARGIADHSRRLADMITNILKLSRLENQQIFPKGERFNLGEQLCEALLQFENIWERENIEIETDIAEDIMVHLDRELLSLVWNNLLSNAFKFTPAGGKISLSLTADESHALVKIQDSGCGMSPETGAHIFEKFYQGDTSHATRGNGLGLALVKRVVDIVHGEITVESELGRGSIFTVKVKRA
ncbi:MAG: HAMP domain-containing histidine kinase [Clostridiales bacterium]|nr:HAMP domain-containing histidine kinase [Clostridiales bacterium]